MSESSILWIFGMLFGVASMLIGALWAYVVTAHRSIWASVSTVTQQITQLQLQIANEHPNRDRIRESIDAAVKPVVDSQRKQSQQVQQINGLLRLLLERMHIEPPALLPDDG